jgi:23S rRNA pseudouridine1911/1915/1917 synthase
MKGTLYAQYRHFVNKCFEICNRQALHAKTIGFLHPTKNIWMQFDSDLPNDMKQLLLTWEDYVAERKTKLNKHDIE